MANSFGSIGDFFPDMEVKCRVNGCDHMIHISGEEAIQKVAHGRAVKPDKMCDECYARLKTLEDKEMPCSTQGCDGKWIWNRYQQLEAYARAKGGEPRVPRGLCPKCKAEMETLTDQQRPCRLKGCKNTWTWTARDQQQSGGKPPAPRLCDECFKIYKGLEDKTLQCRIKGCHNTVVWTKFQQLEHVRAGKSLDNPPARMCDDCMKLLATLKNEEKPCKINGCSGTWTLNAFDQLEVIRNTPEGQDPVMPSRMCKSCFEFYMNAKDIEMPCRNHGCKNTWVWTRSMQLGAHVHGATRPLQRLCAECEKELKNLQDVERPCSVSGCHGTWTYRAEEQLRDRCAMREPPRRRCPSCQEFLSTHKAEQLTCVSCGKSFNWSVQEQLATHLGEYVKPEKCPECVQKEIADIMPPDPSTLVTAGRPIIHIPGAGDWNSDPVIRERPVGMNHATIAKMENCDVRVVCFGDESTLSVSAAELSWPMLLEKQLQQRFGAEGKIGVLNCGIKGSGTAQGVKRFARDIEPFAPRLVIFSFALADAMLGLNEAMDENAQSERLAKLSADFDEFCGKCKSMGSNMLCWLPNPIYPQERKDVSYDPEAFKGWCERQAKFYDLVQSNVRKGCAKNGVELVDARSLFEVNGIKSAQAWMSDWANHNEQGAANIANWLMDRISKARLMEAQRNGEASEPPLEDGGAEGAKDSEGQG